MNELPLYMVFILYLVISSNFLAQLFSCRLQYILNNSMMIKHILGYMTLLFFIVLVSGENLTTNTVLINSLVIYIIFVMSTRMVFNYFVVFIFMSLVLYIVHLYQTKNPEKKQLNTVKLIMQYAILVVLVIGFIFYLVEKKMEYKEKFSYLTFILGKPVCKSSRSKQVLRFVKQTVLTKK